MRQTRLRRQFWIRFSKACFERWIFFSDLKKSSWFNGTRRELNNLLECGEFKNLRPIVIFLLKSRRSSFPQWRSSFVLIQIYDGIDASYIGAIIETRVTQGDWIEEVVKEWIAVDNHLMRFFIEPLTWTTLIGNLFGLTGFWYRYSCHKRNGNDRHCSMPYQLQISDFNLNQIICPKSLCPELIAPSSLSIRSNSHATLVILYKSNRYHSTQTTSDVIFPFPSSPQNFFPKWKSLSCIQISA